jgi:multisubunit Na+/H+ antiporter MnhG subunit
MSATLQRDGWPGCGDGGGCCASLLVVAGGHMGIFAAIGVLRLLATLVAQDDRQKSGGTALAVLSHQSNLVKSVLGLGFSFSSTGPLAELCL